MLIVLAALVNIWQTLNTVGQNVCLCCRLSAAERHIFQPIIRISLSLSILRRSKQLLISHVAEVRRSSNRDDSCFKQEHGLTSTSTLAYTSLLLKVKIAPSQSSNSMFFFYFLCVLAPYPSHWI